MKLPIQTYFVRRTATAYAPVILHVVIPTVFLFSAVSYARAADNPLLGDWEYESQDSDCPLAKGEPDRLFKIHFAKDSETDEFRAASSGPTDKVGKAYTQTTPIKQYVIVKGDPTIAIIGTGGYTRWFVVDANHIKSDKVCNAVYRRIK